jgi:hypothetical protein
VTSDLPSEISTQDSIQDSAWQNLLASRRQPPTHYVPVNVPPLTAHSPLGQHSEPWLQDLL